MMRIEMNPSDRVKINSLLAETPKIAARVTKRAVDRTMGTVKTTVSRVARETLNVYKRDLDQNIDVLKYDVAKDSGAVTIIGASLPIFDFKPLQLLSGVQVKIKKKGPSKVIPGAFIATVKAGKQGGTHTGVFQREWHGPKEPGSINLKRRWKKMPAKYRLPTHELFTTSLPEAVGDKMPMDQILADAGDNLHKNLERELNYELSKM